MCGEFFAQLAADAVDVSFKISVVQELCEHVLRKGGSCAGVKPQRFPKFFRQAVRKHHIARAKRGGNGFGKRVQVDHTPLCGEGKEGLGGL